MGNKIRVKNYKYSSHLGEVITTTTVRLLDDVKISASEFNQNDQEHTLSYKEIKRLSRLVVVQFLKKSYTDYRFGRKILSNSEVRGIISYLGLNAKEFADYLCCNKSKISKVLSGEQTLSATQQAIVIEGLMRESARPGATKLLLGLSQTIDGPEESCVNSVREINEKSTEVA